MIIVLGSFEFQPNDIEQVTHYATAMAANTNREEGCISYQFGWDITNPNQLLLQESWQSLEVLNTHFETEHMALFRQQLGTLTIKQAHATRYDVGNKVTIPVGSGNRQ